MQVNVLFGFVTFVMYLMVFPSIVCLPATSSLILISPWSVSTGVLPGKQISVTVVASISLFSV